MLTSMTGYGQIADNSKRNNPYSPSPEGKYIDKRRTATPSQNAPVEGVFISQSQDLLTTRDRQIVAQRTMRVVNKTVLDPLPPSEIYKVGVGDTLFIDLKNSPQGSRYCTVRTDGTIDFPLAGESIIAAGQTVDAIEEMLASGITLFPGPQVEVKVREFGSHKINVSGLVENPGEKNLQREAMPLYAIISEAIVSAQATKAVIKRAPLVKLELYDLDDPATGNVLIYPGNSVEFISDKPI